VCLLFLLASHARASDVDLPRVRWEDAGKYRGQRVCLEGRVVRVGHTTAMDYLDFHRSDRRAVTVAVPAAYRDRFPKSLEETYRDQSVRVTGRVTGRNTRGDERPVVYVTRAEQVQVVPRGELPTSPHNSHREAALREPTSGEPTSGEPTPGEPAAGTKSRLRVATFNVWNLLDAHDDPYSSDERTAAKPPRQQRQLAEALRTLDADVVALQEVESSGVLRAFLTDYLPDLGYDEHALVEGNDPRGIDVALVSRWPLGRVTSHAALRWEDKRGHDGRFTRDLLCVEVLPEAGTPFEVWGVHLRSNGEDPQAAQLVRTAEARAVRHLLEQRLQREPRARILLAGDFNEPLDGPALRVLLDPDRPRLACLGLDIRPAERVTYTRPNYRSMIDFLLASPAMAEDYCPGSCRIQASPPGGNGSDHLPVVAEFRAR
jgi:endonuclease/exonuclease/phosphatase family metal-dependent hydrolase